MSTPVSKHSPPKPVTAAIIGLGPQGRRLLRALGRMERVRVVAAVDRRPTALAAAELPATARRLSSAEELWQGGGAQLVCVATNGPSHEVLALEALKTGARWLMVEKPMACSLAECDRIILAARKAGARLVVNQSRRHDPVYRWLRERIRSGEWGRLRNVWIQRAGIGLGCLATHSFDLARFLSDREIERVTAWVDKPVGPNPRGAKFVDPGGLVILEMEKGLRVAVAQIEDGAGPMSVELDLTAARIRVDDRPGIVEIIERDLSKKYGPDSPPAYRRVPFPENLLPRDKIAAWIGGLLEELLADKPMDCDGLHGRAAVEALVAAHLSHERGNVPVELPLAGRAERNKWLPVT